MTRLVPLIAALALLATAPTRAEQPITVEAYTAALAALAEPIAGLEELDDLIARAAEARVVLLGESSHGTEQYYTWRAEITRRLVIEHGFNIVAIEGNWASAQLLNDHIQHEPASTDTLADALATGFAQRWPYWMWANELTLNLARDLRAHNADAPGDRRVGFYGLDVHHVDAVIDHLLTKLQAIDADLAARAREHYACLARFDDPTAYARHLAQGGEACSVGVEAVLELLAGHADVMPDDRTRFKVTEAARVVLAAEAHLRAMVQGQAEPWNRRVRHWDAQLARLMKRRGEDARAIVWAHNTHIGDARATAMAEAGMVNIGQLARRRYGPEQVYAIGFATYRGDVTAARAWGRGHHHTLVPRATPTSLEGMLNRLDEPKLLLRFDGRDIPPVLEHHVLHRAKGVVYDPLNERGNYVPTIVPQRYDALIFFHRTDALQPWSAEDR